MDRIESDTFLGNEEHLSSMRRCTSVDVNWLINLAQKKFKFIDEQDSHEFLSSVVDDPNCIVLRTDSACVGVICYQFPYNKNIMLAEDLFLASESSSGWELYFLMKAVLCILKVQGVREFKFDLSSFSRPGKSLEPLARRLGAEKTNDTYRIQFRVLH